MYTKKVKNKKKRYKTINFVFLYNLNFWMYMDLYIMARKFLIISLSKICITFYNRDLNDNFENFSL